VFARVIKSKGFEYLIIAKTYRENKKVKQKVIANLGRVDELNVKSIENIAKKLLEIVDSDKRVEDKRLPNIKELDRVNYGFVAYKRVWKRFKLDDILDSLVEDKSLEYDFKRVVFSLVIDRLLNPKSKLALFCNRFDYLKLNEDLKLHNIYRSLDILAANKERIEKLLFERNKSLFNITTDIVFYDVTTFYYESKNENILKKFGYSKDGKFGDVQIVMGLLIDKKGLPIGYELFSGNTFDSKTMIKILDKLKKQFNIDTVVIVADRGLNSKINLKEIKKNGYDYIMSVSIRKLDKNTKKVCLDKRNLRNIITTEDSEDGLYAYNYFGYYNKIEYEDEDKIKRDTLKEMMVVTYSDKRAKKDRFDRYKALQKANDAILSNDKSIFKQQKGFKRYILKSSKKECKTYSLGIDWQKDKEDKTYEGFYAITTSKLDLDPQEVIESYHNLYKIEDSFKVLKANISLQRRKN